MEFTATTGQSRHSFTVDTKIFFGSNKSAVDTNHYFLKTFALDNRMIGLRYAPDKIHHITNELFKESGGRLLPISHVSTDTGVAVFYVFSYNKGVQTLYERLQTGEAFDLRLALECVIHICEAVKVLHKKQNPMLFYGFLGPDSVLISEDDQVFLINYEIQVTPDIFASAGYDKDMLYFSDPRVTKGGRPIDYLSDIYSVGRLLEYMLTASVAEGNKKRQRIPGRIKRIINQCVDDDESARYQSINELMRDLTQQLDSLSERKAVIFKRIAERRILPASFIMLILLSLSIGAIMIANHTNGVPAEAKRLKNEGNFLKSEWLYMSHIAVNERDASGRMGYVWLLMENELYDRAEKELMPVANGDLKPGQRSEFNLLMGMIREAKADLPAALNHYRSAYNFDKKNIINNVTLINASVNTEVYSKETDNEREDVLADLKNLTKDETVFLFIDAYEKFNKKDYAAAKGLFGKASISSNDYIARESYRYLFEIARVSESGARRIIANYKEVYSAALESGLSLPLILYITEKYAVSLCDNAAASTFTKQEKTAMLHEARELLAGLYERAAIDPDVYIYYAQALREIGSYEIARDVLRTAIEVHDADVRVYVNLVYAEYDYYKNLGGDYSAIESAYDKAMSVLSGNSAYKNDMQELQRYMRQISR